MKHNSKEMRNLLRWPKGKKKRRFSKRYSVQEAEKLVEGSNLKPGDIIHTCSGFNQVIKTIYPEYFYENDTILMDFDITTEDGSGHSWMHCCEQALPKEHIADWYRFHALKAQELFGWSPTGQAELAWFLEKFEKGEPICSDEGFMLPDLQKIRWGKQ